MYTLGFLSTIWGSLQSSFLSLMLLIDSIIYGFIVSVYDIFLILAENQVFTGEHFAGFAYRIQIIMGVVMLFVVSYSLLRAIINPDDLTKGDYAITKVIKNILVSLALVALVPTIFNLMYEFQGIVLQKNVIGRIILGGASVEEIEGGEVGLVFFDENGQMRQVGAVPVPTFRRTDASLQAGGKFIAYQAFTTFFRVSEGYYASFKDLDLPGVEMKHIVYIDDRNFWEKHGLDIVGGLGVGLACAAGIVGTPFGIGVAIFLAGCVGGGMAIGSALGDEIFDFHYFDFATASNQALQSGEFGIFSSFSGAVVDGKVTYDVLLSTAAGIFILYIMISFCIDLALRAVKLGFYQVMAPIPIMLSIIPKQNKVLSNWVKVTLTTFAEVFIRVAIINLSIYLIGLLPEILATVWVDSGPSNFVKALANLFMVLGILMFAKQSPKLISEITGIDSGKMKLGIGAKLGESGGLALAGGLGAGLTSGIRNAHNRKGFDKVTGFLGGAGSGAARGFKDNWNSKGFSDLRSNTAAATKATTDKSDARAVYKADHGGTLGGAMLGHVRDGLSGAKGWATGDKQYLNSSPIANVDYLNDAIAKQDEMEKIFDGDKNHAVYKSEKDRLKAFIEMNGRGANFKEKLADVESRKLADTNGMSYSELYNNADNALKASEFDSIKKNMAAAKYSAGEMIDQLLKNTNYAEAAGLKVEVLKKAQESIAKGTISETELHNIIANQGTFFDSNNPNVENTGASGGLLDVGKTLKSSRTTVMNSEGYSKGQQQKEAAAKKNSANAETKK